MITVKHKTTGKEITVPNEHWQNVLLPQGRYEYVVEKEVKVAVKKKRTYTKKAAE